MKLELKHLAPYLPYRVKIIGNTHGEVGTLSALNENSVQIDGRTMQYGWWADLFDIKLILHPLSDLIKEIEVNGERFVPAEELYEGDVWDWKNDREYYGSFYEWITSFNLKDVETLEFCHVQKLIEWHFDVFGLIDLGLAIDINTLNK